jgi:hypothetical protein
MRRESDTGAARPTHGAGYYQPLGAGTVFLPFQDSRDTAGQAIELDAGLVIN